MNEDDTSDLLCLDSLLTRYFTASHFQIRAYNFMYLLSVSIIDIFNFYIILYYLQIYRNRIFSSIAMCVVEVE